jgi:hypothetical protein
MLGTPGIIYPEAARSRVSACPLPVEFKTSEVTLRTRRINSWLEDPAFLLYSRQAKRLL